MKVLALTSLFPRAAQPALGTCGRDTFLALSRYCEVRVVAPVPAWRILARPLQILSPRREQGGGLDVVFPPFYSVPGIPCIHAPAIALSLRDAMRRLHDEFPWDILVAAWAYPDAAAGAHFARWWDTPLVTIALGAELDTLPACFGIRPQIQWALSRSARVVAVNGELSDQAVALGAPRERVVVQPHGGDVGRRYFGMLEEVLAEWREQHAAVVSSHSP